MSLVVSQPKALGETVSLVFDFASKLSVGETLSSATVVAAVWSGLDSSPSGIVSGSATISGTQAKQKVTGGVAGCIYKLTCTGATSTSNVPVLMTLLAVTQDPI